MPRPALRQAAVWAGVSVAAGVLAGLGGMVLVLLLHLFEFLAFGYRSGSFAEAYQHVPAWRRVLAPVIGALLAGLGWWWLRRESDILALRRMHDERIGVRHITRVLADAVLQILIVGAGASLGREGAPRQTAGVLTGWLAGRTPLSEQGRRLLISAAAGAGLSAVYATPLAGAFFAIEVVLAAWSFRAAVLALVVSAIGTAVALPVTRGLPVYPWPGSALSLETLAPTLLVAPVAGALGVLFERTMARAKATTPNAGPWLVVALVSVGAVVGAATVWLPQLPGNGIVIVEQVLLGQLPWTLLLLLILAKPLATALYLRAGAAGGLLTPALATGALVGAVAALALQTQGVAVEIPLWVIVGAAALLATAQRAPLFAAFFMWELARPPVVVLPVLVVAAGLAYLMVPLARRVGVLK